MNISFIQDLQKTLISGEKFEFESVALDIFKYQSAYNKVYKQYIELLNIDVNKIVQISDIPFLPIECFKYHDVLTGFSHAVKVFQSSGTTAGTSNRSRHLISQPDFYKLHSIRLFEHQFGTLTNTALLCYVPSYHQNPDSSLLFMLQHFIDYSQTEASGFYSFEPEKLIYQANKAHAEGKKVIIFGVTYALLELTNKAYDLHFATIIETGGMKGKHEELTRDEVHSALKMAFNTPTIASEYGMTELLSQFYSSSDGIFSTNETAKVLIRAPEDPFEIRQSFGRGAINIVDLANVHSCSFIATDDMGELFANGTFKVNGRLDAAEVRGCNLLLA